jgi:hypothetical protein
MYFKSLTNIYDLDFFMSKLSSSAQTIANVERMVLSHVSFWEEGDDALFEDNSDDDNEQSKDQEPSAFDEGGHRPLKNVLSQIVTERIANEKK